MTRAFSLCNKCIGICDNTNAKEKISFLSAFYNTPVHLYIYQLKGVVIMEDDYNEYGQYENDYQNFEDQCAWEDMISDMEDYA